MLKSIAWGLVCLAVLAAFVSLKVWQCGELFPDANVLACFMLK